MYFLVVIISKILYLLASIMHHNIVDTISLDPKIIMKHKWNENKENILKINKIRDDMPRSVILVSHARLIT